MGARRGSALVVELAASAVLVTTLVGLLVAVGFDGREVQRAAQRQAELDAAVAAAERWRHGRSLQVPEGWRGEVLPVAGAYEQLRLVAPDGRVFASVRRRP